MNDRERIVEQAKSWIGKKESDGSHKEIVDIYNSYLPHPRGYKLKYDDSWCAGFVSALSIKLGFTDILPVECSCNEMIKLFKKLDCWEEKDSYVPSMGDIIFYDWDDNGKGDNVGNSDHVGIVESVKGNIITVIEGNYTNSVKRRKIEVDGKFIRGYGLPKFTITETIGNWTPAQLKDFILSLGKGEPASEWAEGHVDALRLLNITDGSNPKSLTTREQVITMISRSLSNKSK